MPRRPRMTRTALAARPTFAATISSGSVTSSRSWASIHRGPWYPVCRYWAKLILTCGLDAVQLAIPVPQFATYLNG